MNKLIVLDSGYLMHRSIFSYLNQYNAEIKKIISTLDCTDDEAKEILKEKIKNGEIFLMRPTFTFMRMIIGILKKVGTDLEDQIILAQDYGSWRKQECPSYKGTRKEYRESKADNQWWKDVYNEFNKFLEKIEPYINWNYIKIFNCEGDDVASCCVRYFKDVEKILCSSDKDWEMLCAIPNVKIFSVLTKKYKIVKNPMKVLADHIQGDKSDNLLNRPANEKEFELRKRIVNLLELPDYIENPIKEQLENLPMKNLEIDGIPYKSVKEQLKKLYKL